MKNFFLPFLLFPMIIVMGCSFKLGVPQWSGSGFLRKDFLDYKSVAVLPFEGDDSNEVSKAFAASFHERFPEVLVVDQEKVLEFIQSQALTPGPLDREAILRIGNALGAQALITGNIYYPSITRWFLQIVILDTETSKVMGRSLVEIDHMGAMRKKEAARFAAQKLALW